MPCSKGLCGVIRWLFFGSYSDCLLILTMVCYLSQRCDGYLAYIKENSGVGQARNPKYLRKLWETSDQLNQTWLSMNRTSLRLAGKPGKTLPKQKKNVR